MILPQAKENKMHLANVLSSSLMTAVLLGSALSASAQQERFRRLKLEDTSGDQRALAERMLKETRVGLGGPWNIMLRSPEMSVGLLSLYNYFRWKTALPQPLVELAILTTARAWSVQFEWFAHYPLAIKGGVSPAVLADLRAGKPPAHIKPEEAVTQNCTHGSCPKHAVTYA